MKTEHVYFRNGELMLEGIIHWPDGEGPFPGVVVCHPHPLYGGDMNNNVVLTVANGLAMNNIAAFRFNFRGIGFSEGSYGDGVGEQEDARSALEFLRSQLSIDAESTAVIGYSFGAFAGLGKTVNDEQLKAVVAISPPLTMFDFTFLLSYPKPKLLLMGERDEFTPLDQFRTWANQLQDPKRVEIVPRASHFWIGHERELATTVNDFLEPLLSVSQ